MTNIKNEIIVIGGNHHNTLGVLRSLGRKNISSNLILFSSGDDNPSVKYSRYVKKYFLIKEKDNLIDILLSKFEQCNLKPIIIATSDLVSSILDDNKSLFRKNFIIPCIEGEKSLDYWMDKEKMSEEAMQTGLNIPKSCILSGVNDDISDIDFPCITKPLVSKNGSKSDIVICHTKEELKSYLVSDEHPKIQVQTFIDKEFEYQLIGCSLNSGETVIIPGVSRIIHSPHCTNTGFLKYQKLDDTYNIELCKALIKKTGYSGLFSMEFLRGKDGKDYFMEINFRNDGNAICVTESGTNLPFIWVLYNAGMDVKEEISNVVKELYVLPEFTEIMLLLTRKISLGDFIKDFKLADKFMEYAKDDKSPFIHGSIDFFTNLLKTVFKKYLVRRL